MLRKDSGAHFTYNLGVGLVRTSLLFLLWGLLILTEWYVIGNPSFKFEGTVGISPINVDLTYSEYGNCPVELVATRRNKSTVRFVQYASHETARFYNSHLNTVVGEYNLYHLTGTGKNSGREIGYFATNKGKLGAQWQYYFLTPDTHAPVQTWAIWISFAVSLLLFLMGRRQIRLAMKYPRNDVPVELAGAPDIIYNDDYFRDRAADAVREDMKAAAEKLLLNGNEKPAAGNSEDGK